ncbi:MAG: sporulation protein YunB [Bacilli bacterium]|nr:sporulation protein YunB [Bacilli bacterium]MBQ6282764.1 sporulation protein YunB [Bacilli bacterium]
MKNKINILIIIIFVCIIFSFLLINLMSKKVMPILMEYATSEIKNMSVSIINSTISQELDYFNNDAVKISKNKNDDIQMIEFDSKIVNKFLTDLTKQILLKLKEMENGKTNLSFDKININNQMLYEIPLGRITNNVFVGNLGPKIPIKMDVIGDVYSNIKSNIKEYGINNVLLEIMVNITVNERVIMPFISEQTKISVDVPVSIKLIQGNIPKYYGTGISRNSNILSIPAE